MKNSISLLVSRIDSRISSIEAFFNSFEITSSERDFLLGRISAFRSVLVMISTIFHD